MAEDETGKHYWEIEARAISIVLQVYYPYSKFSFYEVI